MCQLLIQIIGITLLVSDRYRNRTFPLSYPKSATPNFRNHRNGTTTYFHGCVTPIVVSPHQKQVINLEPEFIKKQDGHQKQDCENAAVEFISFFISYCFRFS